MVQELVAALWSLITWSSLRSGHDLDRRGRGTRLSGWPLSQGPRRGSYPIAGEIVHASCRAYLAGGYRASHHRPLGRCPKTLWGYNPDSSPSSLFVIAK